MFENNCTSTIWSRVASTEASEQENVIFAKAVPFLYYELPKSTNLQQQALILYQQIIDARNLNTGIEALMRKLIAVIYDEVIFVRR